MDELKNFINITEEEIAELSLEEIADLKVELEELSLKVEDLIEECDSILND